jgi:choline dehydrogenase-like flavoprotein
MEKLLVVGSGASGVHFALSALKKGYEVTILDVGWEKPDVINPQDNINELKEKLTDPVQYFLGSKFESVVYPGSKDDYYTKYYGTPPSKNHVFSHPEGFNYESIGMIPLISFAQGGLAEAWTGGAYPLNDDELKDYPFQYKDIEPHYGEVARRIGLAGEKDDLSKFFPLHENLIEPLELDTHSKLLFKAYDKNKNNINQRYRSFLGRSRVTTHSSDKGNRKGCIYCGRCLWGCPSEALYTPSITLRECLRYPNLEYLPNMYVKRFDINSEGRIENVVAESVQNRKIHKFKADKYILAAGTLSSSKIFLDSIFYKTGKIVKLTGLMDNRQILVPFLNLGMIGRKYNPESYQYHQVAIGIEGNNPAEYIHGQITTLKSAMVHPIIQNVPLDLRTSMILFRNVRAGLGVVNLNLYDFRRDSNFLTLETNGKSEGTKLVINYSSADHEDQLIKRMVSVTKKILWKLGCIVPPGMVHVRPMGASVHYSGTIPMSQNNSTQTVSKYCQSNDFDNLYIVDGTTMPYLPAKNITFTLMSNAVRVAENAF